MGTIAASLERAHGGASPVAWWRPWPWLVEALVLVPLLAPVVLLHVFARTDPDYWWHTRTGQLILETRALPRADVFSFTAPGQPWVTHEWLTQVLLYSVEQRVGYVGNVLLFGLVSATTGGLVYATCRLRGARPLPAALLMLWALAMSLGSANVRPQVLTSLLLAATALLLTLHLRRGRRRVVWLLPPLFLLWVNLHGGYVIGLALLGLALLAEGVAGLARRARLTLSQAAGVPDALGVVSASLGGGFLRRAGRDARPGNTRAGTPPAAGGTWPKVAALARAARARPLALAALLSVVATLANPNGLEAWTYPFTYAGAGSASMRFLQEWQSPDFHEPYLLFFGAALVLLVVVGVGTGRAGLAETLWTVLLVALALRSYRHIALFAVVVLPLLGARLGTLIPATLATLATVGRRWEPRLLAAVAALGLASSVALAAAVAEQPAVAQVGARPNDTGYPAGAVDYLRAHPELRGPLFNQYEWGGYLLRALYPERAVFVDGRADVYGDRLVEDAFAVERLAPRWRDVLDAYAVQLVLVRSESPLAAALGLDPAWRKVYQGPVETLFRRADTPGA